MSTSDKPPVFPTAAQDAAHAEHREGPAQVTSPSYRLAYADVDFLLREDQRAVRLQLELLKAETLMRERGVVSSVVVFGSARIPAPGEGAAADPALRAKSRYYAEARAFARLAATSASADGDPYVVMTGGGAGIMEAANRGAHDAGAQSVGLNIVLPREQVPNPYVTPELCFQFHYFAIRKLHFLLRARALAIFPGGFGTLDELFDALTLIQTGKMQRIPIVLFGAKYWKRIVDFEAMVEEGVIDRSDLDLLDYAETAAQGWDSVKAFYARGG